VVVAHIVFARPEQLDGRACFLGDARRLDRRAQTGDGEDPPAVRHETLTVPCSPCMEDERACRLGFVDAGSHPLTGGSGGIRSAAQRADLDDPIA
jgi:hypothetical protein